MKKKSNRSTKYESELEQRFFKEWKLRYPKIPIETQWKFHTDRAWRFDFAFPQVKLAVEIQGYGTGHASYASMHKDYEKNNAAISLGWSILYFMGKDLQTTNIHLAINYVNGIRAQRPIDIAPLPTFPIELPQDNVPPALRKAMDEYRERR